MEKNIQIIRSNRKSIGISVKRDLQIIVRAPYGVSNQKLQEIVDSKTPWIEKQIQKMKAYNEKQKDQEPTQKLTKEELQELGSQALHVISERVKYYAPIVGVEYGRITIRNQRTRWGSCSEKGNLNFNCLLMKMPQEAIDYVVVHELCHRLEMNHSSRFWKEVERVYPEYQEARAWIKMHGAEIMQMN